MYQAGDGGWFFLACGNQSFWAKLCKALGREDLVDDPRFGSWLARRDNADALTPLLEAAFKSKPRDEWLKILAEYDIPAAGTQPLRDFMRDPAVSTTRWPSRTSTPRSGAHLMGQPLRFSESPVPDAGPPPTLGQHTAEILREAGYADADIADLAGAAHVASSRKDLPA